MFATRKHRTMSAEKTYYSLIEDIYTKYNMSRSQARKDSLGHRAPYPSNLPAVKLPSKHLRIYFLPDPLSTLYLNGGVLDGVKVHRLQRYCQDSAQNEKNSSHNWTFDPHLRTAARRCLRTPTAKYIESRRLMHVRF